MNLFDAGNQFLAQSLFQNSISVSYASGGEVYTLSAVRAGVSWNSIDRSGSAPLESSARDYIFKRSEVAFTPKPKDKITDGETVWTVYNQLDNECYRNMADTGLIRIHCKK